MSYVELSSSEISNLGCYVYQDSQKPYFNMTSIFAANINGSDVNKPVIFFNPEIYQVVDSGLVEEFHQKGMKVLITLLGNHENAGWSCMTDEKAAKEFASKVSAMVNKYNLDGVDIDDEYSACASNDYSLIMMAKAIKEDPGFKGKLLTKALWSDYSYFMSEYKGHHLADYLDYGWEMSYGGGSPEWRLKWYSEHGMKRSQLSLGFSNGANASTSAQWTKEVKDGGYGGVMIYNVMNTSESFLDNLSMAEGSGHVVALPNCLK